MTKCEPGSAISPVMKKNHWKVIPYELVGGRKGKMIWASPETAAPVMNLPLNAKGWHAIFVGVFSGPESTSKVWIKLDSDKAAVNRTNNSNECYGNVLEAFF